MSAALLAAYAICDVISSAGEVSRPAPADYAADILDAVRSATVGTGTPLVAVFNIFTFIVEALAARGDAAANPAIATAAYLRAHNACSVNGDFFAEVAAHVAALQPGALASEDATLARDATVGLAFSGRFGDAAILLSSAAAAAGLDGPAFGVVGDVAQLIAAAANLTDAAAHSAWRRAAHALQRDVACVVRGVSGPADAVWGAAEALLSAAAGDAAAVRATARKLQMDGTWVAAGVAALVAPFASAAQLAEAMGAESATSTAAPGAPVPAAWFAPIVRAAFAAASPLELINVAAAVVDHFNDADDGTDTAINVTAVSTLLRCGLATAIIPASFELGLNARAAAAMDAADALLKACGVPQAWRAASSLLLQAPTSDPAGLISVLDDACTTAAHGGCDAAATAAVVEFYTQCVAATAPPRRELRAEWARANPRVDWAAINAHADAAVLRALEQRVGPHMREQLYAGRVPAALRLAAALGDGPAYAAAALTRLLEAADHRAADWRALECTAAVVRAVDAACGTPGAADGVSADAHFDGLSGETRRLLRAAVLTTAPAAAVAAPAVASASTAMAAAMTGVAGGRPSTRETVDGLWAMPVPAMRALLQRRFEQTQWGGPTPGCGAESLLDLHLASHHADAPAQFRIKVEGEVLDVLLDPRRRGVYSA